MARGKGQPPKLIGGPRGFAVSRLPSKEDVFSDGAGATNIVEAIPMVAPVRHESYRDERGRYLLKRTLVLQSVCGVDCEATWFGARARTQEAAPAFGPGATIGRARHWYRSRSQTRDNNDAILSGSVVPAA